MLEREVEIFKLKLDQKIMIMQPQFILKDF